MAQIIAVANNKGGVGKTTTSGCIAAALAKLGHRTLMGDLDSQANLSSWHGAGKTARQNMGEFLSASITDAAAWPTVPIGENLELLPSHKLLGEYQAQLRKKKTAQPYYLLRDRLHQLMARHRFDYVVLDCPPNILDGMTDYALCAATAYILPADPEPFAVEGLIEMLNVAKQVQQEYNPALQFAGFVFPKYNPAIRGALRQQLLADIGTGFGPTTILGNVRQDARIYEAQGLKQSIYEYAPDSRGAEDYLKITKKLIKQH